MIIIETRCELFLFKQRPVRIEALSLAIHKQMCSKILDNVDEVVVELWFIHTLSFHVRDQSHSPNVAQTFEVSLVVDIC